MDRRHITLDGEMYWLTPVRKFTRDSFIEAIESEFRHSYHQEGEHHPAEEIIEDALLSHPMLAPSWIVSLIRGDELSMYVRGDFIKIIGHIEGMKSLCLDAILDILRKESSISFSAALHTVEFWYLKEAIPILQERLTDTSIPNWNRRHMYQVIQDIEAGA